LIKKFNTVLDSIKNLTSRGLFTDAHKSIDKLLKQNPTSKELLNTKATIFIYQGFFNESLKLLQKCINLYPNDSETFYNLGVAYHNSNQQDLAIESFENCIENDSANVDAYLNLARIFIQTLSIKNALSTISSLTDQNAHLEICYHLQAQCFRLINDFENQKKSLEIAIKINPSNANNFIYLAFIFLWKNKPTEAKEYFKKALELNPKNTFAIYNLMEIDKNFEYYSNLELLIKINERYHLSDFDLIYFNLCLSKFYENKDEEKYIDYLFKANKLKKQTINFDINYFLNINEQIFDKYHFLTNASSTLKEYKPIFIVGLPRSGSSITEQILINSPDVQSCGEVEILNYEFMNNLNSLNENILNNIGNKYLNHIKLITNSKIFIDKLPVNFFWIGLIKIIFPQAKFIFTSRNIFDNCFSIFKTFFGDSALPFSYNVKDIRDFYNLHVSIIESWIALLDKNIHKFEYEKLIANPEDEVIKLFNFLELKYDRSYLNLNNSDNFIQTASFSQARNKIEKQASYKKYHKFFPDFL